MWTLAEIQANIAIMAMLESPEKCGYKGLAATPHLNVFRPRCPACRNVLQDSPWLDGLRLMWCRQCGHKYRECL